MKRIIIFLLSILLLVPLVSAHAIEKGPITKTTQTYEIQFLTEPKFPVTAKTTNLNFVIKDKQGNLLSNLNTKIELHKQSTIILDLNEQQKGRYSTDYNFNEPGNYEIHLIINNKELETEFNLEVDSFGVSGWLRSSTIVILLLILVGLMVKDCRRNKNG